MNTDENRRKLNAERKRKQRKNEEYRRNEQQRNTSAHKIARTDEERRHTEQEKDTESHRKARIDHDRRRAEQEKDTESHRSARSDQDRRRFENSNNAERMKSARTNENRRRTEQEKNTSMHKLARLSIKESIVFEDLRQQYESRIKVGPTIICNSCNGLWFPSSIIKRSTESFCKNNTTKEFLETVCTTMSHELNLCTTCHRDIVQMKTPKMCKANGFEFKPIPSELQNLTTLEERMVSPRIPFMQIRSLGVDKQYGLQGNVVNVPVSVDTSVNILPRAFDNTHTVQIKLKRKMCYKSHYKFEAVRPSAIINAARYLVITPLYQEENIQISNEWIANHNNELENFVILDEDKNDDGSDTRVNNTEEEWNEVDQPDNAITTSTLWHDQCTAIAFAPGEGKHPLSLFRDKFAEELSFPSVYCGHARNISIKASYVDICKWELRYKDRRCCKMDKIFFMYKKRQIQMLTDQINLHLRKSRRNTHITAGQLLNNEFVENLCKIDDGYKFLKVDRSSPVYWEERKREVLAMIRQLGIPTLFVTFSAAETKWSELIVILMKTVKGIDITEESASNMDYQQKCELISNDPVTCARYFDKRIRELFRVLEHSRGPFCDNPITDSYIRVEFQHRGSPHVHCLLWMKNTPVYIKGETNQQCIDFIDKYITVDSNTSDEQLNPLISLQTHRHSFSCKKVYGNETVCRFNFPQLPIPNTMILEPLEDMKNKEQFNNTYNKLVHSLKNSQQIENFASFLSSNELTLQQYIMVLRSKIKHPKVFVKRDIQDMKVNNYNATILKLHRANMDIQFILDPYSCVQYILNYLNKAERGMSKLLKEAVEEVKSGNYSIRDRLKIVGDRYLNATEVSAQEAVYQLLSMEMSRSSRAHVFINTGEREQRYTLVKSEQQLKNLNEDSTDIYQSNSIEYYSQRPEELSKLCLADFLADYNRHKTISAKKQQKLDSNDDNEKNPEEITGQLFALKNNCGFIEKRNKVKIIRFRRYNIKTDELNYYREQCMLFLPWFNESDELVNVDIKTKYFENVETIYFNSVKYIHNYTAIKDFEDTYKDIAYEAEKESENLDEDHDYTVYSIDNNASYSLSEDIGGVLPITTIERFLTPKCISDDKYFAIMRSLNLKQRNFCDDIIYRVKNTNEQLFGFVFGGAGTGKSMLIKAINQSLLRIFNSQPGACPDSVKVLLCAPTGKAAFNIGGMTLHSAFSLPVNQCKSQIKSLSADLRNTLQCKLQDLKMIIIDEISMVGATMFKHVDHRLREIFHSTEKFGGKSVLCFGDFHQLRPVQDKFVFQNIDSNYDALFPNTLWESFRGYELTEIMRQKDDLPFATALNNLAIGKLTPEDIALFKSREIRNVFRK